MPEWLPLAALGGAFALIAGLWFWRRRSRRPAAVDNAPATAPATSPAVTKVRPAEAVKPAAPATPQADSAPPDRAIIGRRADIAIDFEPVHAQSTLINFRLRYVVTITNNGQIPATPVLLRVGLFAGTNAHPQGVASWYNLPIEAEHHRIEAIAPGESQQFDGELAAPLDALNALVVEGRAMAIPLIAVDVRYHHGDGEAPLDGQTARAFVVGREPSNGAAKLAPFRLDQGPTSFAPLGRRDTGISKTE